MGGGLGEGRWGGGGLRLWGGEGTGGVLAEFCGVVGGGLVGCWEGRGGVEVRGEGVEWRRRWRCRTCSIVLMYGPIRTSSSLSLSIVLVRLSPTVPLMSAMQCRM